jgi:hypothetical protein
MDSEFNMTKGPLSLNSLNSLAVADTTVLWSREPAVCDAPTDIRKGAETSIPQLARFPYASRENRRA